MKERKSLKETLERLQIPWPRCGAWVGEGWEPIVIEALEKMVTAGWNKNLGQVKQKFCQLTIYGGDQNPAVLEIIEEARKKADLVCEECGDPRPNKPGFAWGMAHCTKCDEAHANKPYDDEALNKAIRKAKGLE